MGSEGIRVISSAFLSLSSILFFNSKTRERSTSRPSQVCIGGVMHLFELTRSLVDIESITNHEQAVGSFVFEILSNLAARSGGRVERCPVEANRFNVFAHWRSPVVTLSTIWTPCRLFSLQRKMTNLSGAAVPPTPKVSSRP